MEFDHFGIEKSYFEENFDLNQLIKNLPERLSTEYLTENKDKLEKSLTVVSRKVSELILSHQPTYVEELQRIANLQKSITDSIRVCSQGRSCLRFIKTGTGEIGSTIIEHHKKRESLSKLLVPLTAISELRRTVLTIRSLIEQENFPEAIRMCKDAEKSLAKIKEFKCVDELGSRINVTLEYIGEKVDIVLSRMCHEFDYNIYSKLQESYILLNRSEIDFKLNFFSAHHRSSISELTTFLENEIWEMVPVKTDFKLVQLKEFAFLREPQQTVIKLLEAKSEDLYSCPDYISQLPTDRISLSSDSENSELNEDFVREEGVEDDDDESDIMNQQQEQVEREQRQNPIPNVKSAQPPLGPVLTNSSLNVLRLIGKYIQMMIVLEPIAYEILLKIYELLDFYIKFVFKKFGPDRADRDETLRRLISGQASSQDQTSNKMSPQKSVAIGSLIFLVNQIWNLQEYLESLISAEFRAQLKEQFSKPNSIIPDFLKARAEL